MSSSKKVVSGKVTKRVDCSNCGRSYEYEMSRVIMGNSSKDAANQAEADAQALNDANTKLQAALADGCDPVACPSCGALTKEMKTYRWKRFGAALTCIGVGVGILLVVYCAMLLTHRIHIFGALMGIVCVLLGVILLAISIIDLAAPKKGRI